MDTKAFFVWLLKNIIGLIMIKSSDKKINNNYRILRVLENKDLLVIDSQRQYYIFAQFYNDIHNIHHNLSPPPRKNTNSQANDNSNILYYQELIMIDALNYLAFKMPNKDILWANNIQLEKLSQKTFLNSIIKQALLCILDKLLWLGADFIHRVLNNKNFFLVNGHLYFILMPRNTNKILSLKRNEKHRSLSSDVTISTILKKQSSIVKDFCQIIWLIIKKTPFCVVKNLDVEDKAPHLLSDLITKNTNLQSALQKLSSLQIKNGQKNHEELKFIKKQNIRRRSTIDNCSLFKPQKNLLFNRYNQNLLSKRMKTEQIIRSQKVSTQKQEKITFYPKHSTISVQKSKDQQNLKVFNRKNYLIQSQLQVAQKTPTKIQAQTISIYRQKRSASILGKQKTQYNKWILQRKTKRLITDTFQQKIQNQTRKALQRFQLSCCQSKNVEGLKQKEENLKQKEQKLKNRLLQRIIKFKVEKLQKSAPVYQQSIHNKYQTNQKIRKSSQTEFIYERSNDNEQIIQLTQSLFTQDKRQIKIDDFKMVQKHSYLKQEEQVIQKQQNRKIEYKRLRNKVDNYTSSQPKNKSLRKYQDQKHTLNKDYTESQLQEIVLEPKKQKQQKKDTIFKRTKILQANQFQQLEDFQTLHFETQLQQERAKRKQTEQSIHHLSQNEQKDAQKHIKVIQLLITEYLTFINILGDITASAIQNKIKLNKIQWRRTVYFLYQRFYYQRLNFYDNLKNKNTKIIRANKSATELQWNTWNKSAQRQIFLKDVQRQNTKLYDTFKKFISKLQKQDNNLDASFKQFLKGWQKILHNRNRKNRFIISKYGTAIFINEYDRVKEARLETKESLHFLQDCLYGLKIIAELQGLTEKNKPLDLTEYKRYTKKQEQLDSQVEQLYELFFQQSQENLHT